MTDEGSAQLATLLRGHVLTCMGLDAGHDGEEDGFWPITVSATDLGDGKTQLNVATADPDVGFGDGGDHFDDTEVTPTWVIISDGDDGRRHLFFQGWDWTGWSYDDLKCDPADSQPVGDIAAIVSEIWDAGSISSTGAQCCLR